MRILTQFGDVQQWAWTYFGAVVLGNVRHSWRIVTLAAGWARQLGASIPN